MSQREILIVNMAATGLRLVGNVSIGIIVTPLLVRGLGIELFGLLETVGASGLLLSLTTQGLSTSISRELSFWVGADDAGELARAFSTSLAIQVLAGLLVFTIGFALSPWVAARLTVPTGYEMATVIALRLTALSFGLSFALSPFASMLLAHQDLRTFSLQTFLRKLATLLAALALPFGNNKLVTYVTVLLGLTTIANLLPVVISLRRHREAWPRPGLVSLSSAKSIGAYASLALVGSLGEQSRRTGVAIFLNIFFGNVVAGANGVAIRLARLVRQFVDIFVPVLQPAMTVNTGAGKQHVTVRLVTFTSAVSLAIAMPIVVSTVFNTDAILEFWLRSPPPPNAAIFGRTIIVALTIGLVSKGHELAMHATSRVGMLISVFHALIITALSASMILAVEFKEPIWVLYGELIGVAIAAMLWQPFWVAKKLDLAISDWIRMTLYPSVVSLVTCLVVAGAVSAAMPAGLTRAIAMGMGTLCCTTVTMWFLALEKAERGAIANSIYNVATRQSVK